MLVHSAPHGQAVEMQTGRLHWSLEGTHTSKMSNASALVALLLHNCEVAYIHLRVSGQLNSNLLNAWISKAFQDRYIGQVTPKSSYFHCQKNKFLRSKYPNKNICFNLQVCFDLSDSDRSEFRFIRHFSGNNYRSTFLYTIYREFRRFDIRFIGLFQDTIQHIVCMYEDATRP